MEQNKSQLGQQGGGQSSFGGSENEGGNNDHGAPIYSSGSAAFSGDSGGDVDGGDSHPTEIQRNDIPRRFGLEPPQVESWFQNKPSQLKTVSEHEENEALIYESITFGGQKQQCIEATRKNTCSKCSFAGSQQFPEENILRSEYIRLREETEKLKSTSIPVPSQFRHSIIQLVVLAAEELKVMAIAAGKFWISSSADGSASLLNEEEYLEYFSHNFGPTRFGYTCEASRHISRVLMNPTHLLKILMNVNEWSLMFSAIVSSAVTMEVLSEGVDYNAALHVISAEYHIPTPLVPNRQSYFARYCTQHCEGVWAVVDVSLDNIIPALENTTCQKRPSGCLIQDMYDGTSKITWIEHVYVDNNDVSTMGKHLLHSGLGFGAKRWVSILEKQCQRLTTETLANAPETDFNNQLISSPEGRRAILKLAERMVNNFTFGITGPKAGKWTKLYPNFGEDIRLMSRRVMNEPGLPDGTLLSVATSFALSLAPKMVFDFFRDHRSRKEWDIFANRNDYEPVYGISYGEEPSNCVSIYKVPMMHGHMLVLQESWSDPVASHIVFAPAEIETIDIILGGGNPNSIPLLPSGFTILPDGPSFRTEGSCGTLLTVSFQILMNKSPAMDINVVAVSKVAHFLRCSCEKIKLALGAVGPHT